MADIRRLLHGLGEMTYTFINSMEDKLYNIDVLRIEKGVVYILGTRRDLFDTY